MYILGFWFDKFNLKNIGFYDTNYFLSGRALKLKGKTVFITNFGDSIRVRLIIEEIFEVHLYKESESESEEIQKDNKEKKSKHSFWRSKEGGRNDVYISTKPVFQALTEDFI